MEAVINDFGAAESSASSAELSGSLLALVGFLPLSEELEIFARMGNLWWYNKITVLDSFSDNLFGDESFYGAGVQLGKNEAGVAFDRNFDVASVRINFSL